MLRQPLDSPQAQNIRGCIMPRILPSWMAGSQHLGQPSLSSSPIYIHIHILIIIPYHPSINNASDALLFAVCGAVRSFLHTLTLLLFWTNSLICFLIKQVLDLQPRSGWLDGWCVGRLCVLCCACVTAIFYHLISHSNVSHPRHQKDAM